ncbi:hypothetical protein B0T14DRAFT_89589 [Immersiella caudata]|uniref:Uncharacterized protein n=1 Tax=Immersiella caudata TaxID=314043 RepID=A0AA39X2D7_9PEZI|nr:hypothetical protein B0T14DRAFT_89589 [Immersiella caudata]
MLGHHKPSDYLLHYYASMTANVASGSLLPSLASCHRVGTSRLGVGQERYNPITVFIVSLILLGATVAFPSTRLGRSLVEVKQII